MSKTFIDNQIKLEPNSKTNEFYHGSKTKVQMFIKLKTDEVRHFTTFDQKDFDEYDITHSFLVQRFNIQTNTGIKEDKIIGRDYTRKRAGQKTSSMTLDFIITNFIILDIANGFAKDGISDQDYSLTSYDEQFLMKRGYKGNYEFRSEYIPSSIDLIITVHKSSEEKEIIYIKNAVITSSSFEMNADSFLTGSLKLAFNKPYFLKDI